MKVVDSDEPNDVYDYTDGPKENDLADCDER